MIKKTLKGNLVIRQFEHLSKYPELKHFVSGREGGVSNGELGGLNLSYNVDDNVENVKENRKRLASALKVDRLVFPEQTHSDHVKVVLSEKDLDYLKDTDGLVTQMKGLCIAVMSADCVPVLIYDPVEKVVGAVHAGWRGTVSLIAQKAVKAMIRNFNCEPQNMIVGIGPSICKEVYETGSEVVSAFHRVFGKEERIVTVNPGTGKGHLDLWEANKVQLLDIGVLPGHIELAETCTYKENKQYFSARYSAGKAGRFAAGIMVS
ncbi:peptidoglycan editing factor PgeF [Cytophagaceae bacterium ABcell3]|nr:peptidoglycan editing factor PgeF [Cytophagaceae bacterium ABcell3]